jgi:hypothetical protein
MNPIGAQPSAECGLECARYGSGLGIADDEEGSKSRNCREARDHRPQIVGGRNCKRYGFRNMRAIGSTGFLEENIAAAEIT